MSWVNVLRSAALYDGLLDGRARTPFGRLVRLLIGGVILALSAQVGLWLDPFVVGAHFAALLPAAALVTLICGALSGLWATAIAVLIAHYVFGLNFSTPDGYSLGLFVVASLVNVAVISLLLAANARARAVVRRVQQLNASLRASEARFRGFLETAPDAIVIAGRDGRIALLNAEAERMFGYDRTELIDQHIDRLMPERFRGRHQPRIDAFLADPGIRRMGDGGDMHGRRKDGSEFPIETNLSPLPGPDEGLISSVIRDLTARKEVQERQSLLVRELNHRVKNTLASVQSIVAQTLKSSPTPADFSDAFSARITALSQSHDVLTRNDWSGALVRDIVAEQLSPYERASGEPFALSGPDVKLRPNRAVTLGMALGELATNAAKFGALSGDGAVEVNWEVGVESGVRRIRIRWTERGGPAVAPPTRHGFGSRLIERSVASGLHGVSEIRFEPTGVVAVLDLPLLPGEA